jgi:ABC-type Fe3+ transport system substrate-binding protein
LTHYSVLWNRLGPDELKKWHQSLVLRGCHFVKGNGAVKDLVASGACDFGLTDTDDFFVAQDAKFPVTMLPVKVDGKTICIPNTVSVVHGTKHRAQAEKLAAWLLTAETEIKLSHSESRQSPVHNGIDPAAVPPEVRPLLEWSREAVPLSNLEKSRDECLSWLQTEFAP